MECCGKARSVSHCASQGMCRVFKEEAMARLSSENKQEVGQQRKQGRIYLGRGSSETSRQNGTFMQLMCLFECTRGHPAFLCAGC